MKQFFSFIFFLIWSVSSITCRHAQMLHVAAGCSKLNCISYLINLGANPNAIDLMEIYILKI